MRKVLLITFILISINVIAQENANEIFWSSDKKLTVNDFGIISKSSSNPCFCQFSINYKLRGFDFLTSNFNKKVTNVVIKSASWIDTTQNVILSLRYEQTLFDIAEIYTRKFRKGLKDNKKELIKGFKIAEELNSKTLTEFSERRLSYDKETNYGYNNDKQKEWEIMILNELNQLSDFDYNKK